ncbi:MAG: hypothetical protein KF688_03450 [Pirellulales bacterium]|nr:hypothetical protein [Pirellulales bacterium]
MDADATQPLTAYGFLTAVEQPGGGFYGGYLVLSPQGRPLEFRCTTPVRPSRAQEILYGASLRPYLLGELLGGTLLADATLPVVAVLTDLPDMAQVATIRREPVFVVAAEGVAACSPLAPTPQAASPNELPPISTKIERPGTTAEACVPAVLAPLAAHVALAEPFERIRAALREAHDVAQETTELHGESRAA